jgi:hypothetical protein
MTVAVESKAAIGALAVRLGRFVGAASAMLFSIVGVARADQPVSCGGVAMAGGAEIVCNHVLPTAPPQFCTFSWALVTTSGSTTVAQGTFLIAPGMADDTVYQGFGFASALSNPIVLCQGRHG